MKNKKTNKGFTLVELLVSVVILGIITALVIPEVSKLIYSNKQTKFKSYEKSVVTGAKLYTDSYKLDMFGNNSSGCYDIKLKDIANKKMLEDIKVRDTSCIDLANKGKANNTYVRVYKSGDHYQYQVKFTCRDNKNEVLYETKNGLEENKSICDGKKIDLEPPKIEIIENNGISWHTGRNKKVRIKISDVYGLLENTRIKYAWTKNPSSNPNFKTINARNKRYDTETYFTIQVPQRENGLWYLLIEPVSVKDTNGNYTLDRVTSNVFQLDNTPPICTLSTNGTKGNNNWYVTNASISINKSDAVGEIKEYGLTTSNAETYNNKAQQTQTETKGASWYGYVKDKAGNTTKCNTSLKVDTTKPAITLQNDSNSNWVNRNVIISGNITENTSGISKYYYGYDKNNVTATDLNLNGSNLSGVWSGERNNEVFFQIVDNAGNKSIIESAGFIRIDKTPPSISFDNGPGTYDNSSGITVSSSCSDLQSGVSSKSENSWISSPSYGKYINHECIDKAGNSANIDGNYYVRTYGENSACDVKYYNQGVCSTTCTAHSYSCLGGGGSTCGNSPPGCSSGEGIFGGYSVGGCCQSRNNYCRRSDFGVESYYSCWHY